VATRVALRIMPFMKVSGDLWEVCCINKCANPTGIAKTTMEIARNIYAMMAFGPPPGLPPKPAGAPEPLRQVPFPMFDPTKALPFVTYICTVCGYSEFYHEPTVSRTIAEAESSIGGVKPSGGE
jgi:hypothetical protein